MSTDVPPSRGQTSVERYGEAAPPSRGPAVASRYGEAGAEFSRFGLAAQESPLRVEIAGEADRQAWDAFVSSRADAFCYHEWAWREVFERTFGHEPIYLIARAGTAIRGVLPLVFMRSRLFGRFLVSLPFVNYAGVLAEEPAVARALLDRSAELAGARACSHVELRHMRRRFDQLPVKQHKVTMWLPIGPGMWDILDRKVRNQVRKAQKSNLIAVRGGAELVPEFYRVFTRNMRDLGTPVYSRDLFERVLALFPGRAHIVVVRLGTRPIAAGVSLRTRTGVEVPWASSIREFNHLCPNHLLYWTFIEAAVAEGADRFDFGRSTPGEGTYKFKEQWGAEAIPLAWEYVLSEGGALPDQSPKNPKFRLAIDAWRRCPLWLANRLGPRIVRSIP